MKKAMKKTVTYAVLFLALAGAKAAYALPADAPVHGDWDAVYNVYATASYYASVIVNKIAQPFGGWTGQGF